MNTQKEGRGFTIIEVVLVLAIAGLIFLMVFIALPALQRNQRDSARKQEISTVLAQITSYQSNNRGGSPVGNEVSFAKYLDTDKVTDNVIELPSGNKVTIGDATTLGLTLSASTDASIGDEAATNDNMYVVIGAKCGTSEGSLLKGTSRQAAAIMVLENGGTKYCQTN